MSPRAGLLVAALATLAAQAQGLAETDYLLHCRGCHGPDGRGHGAVPALDGNLGLLLDRPGGRAYLVQVPGVARAALDDARLAALLNWLLARFAAPATAPGRTPYSAAEIGRLRRTPLIEARAARAQLLRRPPQSAP